jgi:hypothetical protein
MDDNKCAFLLDALTIDKLQNEFEKLFRKVGMHCKGTKN